MLNVRPGYGAVALDVQQQLDALTGWSVIDGLDVVADGGFTLTIEQGSALCDANVQTPDEQQVELEYPDPEYPRRDVVYLNQYADGQVEPGEPNPVTPQDADQFDAFSPWPYSMHDIGSTVLAEVWVEPNANEIIDDNVRMRRMPASRSFGDVSAQSMSVATEPQDDNDVMRLQDYEARTDETTISGGTLDGHIDANGNNIIDIGQATADNFLVSNPSQELEAVVNRRILQNFYELSGDTLSGDMDADGNNINNIDQMNASSGSFTDSLEIPETDGIPDEGHIWINRNNL